MLIGVGILLFHFDCPIAIIWRYGCLAEGLGLDQLFGSGPLDTPLTPSVVAGTMAVIVNVLGILTGAVVLVMTLVNLYVSSIVFDALVTKNRVFLFGHVVINATIYMAILGVYELLPKYSGRPWAGSRPFLSSWAAVLTGFCTPAASVQPARPMHDFSDTAVRDKPIAVPDFPRTGSSAHAR